MPVKRLFPLALVLSLVACSQPTDSAPAAVRSDEAAASAKTDTTQSASPSSSSEYLLTMASVEAFFAAQPRLAAAVEADPSLDPAMDASEEDAGAFARRLEAAPALREAITGSGISVHDYARTSEQLMGALLAQGALDAGLLTELPDGISTRNVEFVRTHKAEIQAMAGATQG